jgi:hypothetical protein
MIYHNDTVIDARRIGLFAFCDVFVMLWYL